MKAFSAIFIVVFVFFYYRLYLSQKVGVLGRLCLRFFMFCIALARHAQYTAQFTNRVFFSVKVYEFESFICRCFFRLCAKKAAALLSISFVRLNSRTSCRNRLFSSAKFNALLGELVPSDNIPFFALFTQVSSVPLGMPSSFDAFVEPISPANFTASVLNADSYVPSFWLYSNFCG